MCHTASRTVDTGMKPVLQTTCQKRTVATTTALCAGLCTSSVLPGDWLDFPIRLHFKNHHSTALLVHDGSHFVIFTRFWLEGELLAAAAGAVGNGLPAWTEVGHTNQIALNPQRAGAGHGKLLVKSFGQNSILIPHIVADPGGWNSNALTFGRTDKRAESIPHAAAHINFDLLAIEAIAHQRWLSILTIETNAGLLFGVVVSLTGRRVTGASA